MIDNQKVQEITLLIAACFFGAFALAAIVFIMSLAGSRSGDASSGAGVPDAASSTSR